MNPEERPSPARAAYRELAKLAKATITATSPSGRVAVSGVGADYRVRLRAKGFVYLDPADLADEVVQTFESAMSAYRGMENKILAGYAAVAPKREPAPGDAHRRERVEQLRRSIRVELNSASKMVHGSWHGDSGVRLRVAAVNESHREQLADELGAVLTGLSAQYRAALREATREAAIEVAPD